MDFPQANRKQRRKITPEEKRSAINQINKWRRDHKDLVTPEWWRQVWAYFNDDSEKILEYIKALDKTTFSEKVAHYEKVMTSPTAKFELPDGPGVQRCPHGKEIMKGRPVRCMECYSMDC